MNLRNVWFDPRFLIALTLGVCLVGSYSYRNSQAALVEADLRREYELVSPPSDARLLERQAHHKPGSAYIEFHYSSPLAFESVVEYYRGALQERGWDYKQRLLLPSNIESVEFCKGSYSARLERDTSANHIFWFGMNWGLNSCEKRRAFGPRPAVPRQEGAPLIRSLLLARISG